MQQRSLDTDSIQGIHTDDAPRAIGPYSQATIANGFIFVSGQLPLVPGTADLCSDEIAEQTEQCLRNISAILSSAGATLADVVKTTVLLTDLGSFARVNDVYAGYFDGDVSPARATYQVTRLPRDAQIEIEAIGLVRGEQVL